MPTDKTGSGSTDFGLPPREEPDFGLGSDLNAELASTSHSGSNFDSEPKLSVPSIAEVEKAYANDNRLIEQCEDEALEALFGAPISGRIEDAQNAHILTKLNDLVGRFNVASNRLEKIEQACQLLSESLVDHDTHVVSPLATGSNNGQSNPIPPIPPVPPRS